MSRCVDRRGEILDKAMLSESHLAPLLESLRTLPQETEWVEFKVDNKRPDDIGANISALSNSAVLLGKEAAYVIWGIDDSTHSVVGTSFEPRKAKGSGNQELESWLSVHLKPSLDFRFHEFRVEGKSIVLL